MGSFVSRWLTALTMLGCLVGFGVGMLCQSLEASVGTVQIVGFVGALWVRALKCFVVPMIFTSMIVSVSAMSGEATSLMASLVKYSPRAS